MCSAPANRPPLLRCRARHVTPIMTQVSHASKRADAQASGQVSRPRPECHDHGRHNHGLRVVPRHASRRATRPGAPGTQGRPPTAQRAVVTDASEVGAVATVHMWTSMAFLRKHSMRISCKWRQHCTMPKLNSCESAGSLRWRNTSPSGSPLTPG